MRRAWVLRPHYYALPSPLYKGAVPSWEARSLSFTDFFIHVPALLAFCHLWFFAIFFTERAPTVMIDD
jgi:hypothetical protein